MVEGKWLSVIELFALRQSSRVSDAKNLPRIVVVIGNAAVRHSSLGHNGVETGVADRESTAAAGRLMADERVDGGVSAVFLLDFLVPLSAEVEEDASDSSQGNDDATNHAADDSTNVGRLLFGTIVRGSRGSRSTSRLRST